MDHDYLNEITAEESLENQRTLEQMFAEINAHNSDIVTEQEEDQKTAEALRIQRQKEMEEAARQEYFDRRFEEEQRRRKKHLAEMAAREEAKEKRGFSFSSIASQMPQIRPKEKPRKLEISEKKKDSLTGVWDKAQLDQDIASMALTELCVVSASVNHLQHTNTLYGTGCGDAFLKAVGSICKRSFPAADVYRVYGDWFLIVLPFQSYEQLDNMEDKLSQRARELQKRFRRKYPKSDFSIAQGHATYIEGDSFSDLVGRAKNNMLKAKDIYRAAHPEFAIPEQKSDPEQQPETKVPTQERQERQAPDAVQTPVSRPAPKPSRVISSMFRHPSKKKPKAEKKKPESVRANIPSRKEVVPEIPPEDTSPVIRSGQVAVSLSEDALESKERLARGSEIELRLELIHELQHRRNELIVLMIATNDLHTLFLLRDTDEFFDFLTENENRLQAAYVYAVYRTERKNYISIISDPVLLSVFEALADLFTSGEKITSRTISQIPDIGIFKELYV